MGTRTIERNWYIDGLGLTDPTSMTLIDPTGAYGVKRDDTNATVVAAGTAMTKLSTGLFAYTFTEPAPGLAYTAWVRVIYLGTTYYFQHSLEAVTSQATTSMGVTFQSLQAKLAGSYFGQWSVATPLTVGSPFPSADQIVQINDCIRDGLQAVYQFRDWSFLRQVLTINTIAPYTAATITLASGVVTLVTGTLPTWLALTSTVSFKGKTYNLSSTSPVTLVSPPADIAVATPATFTPSPIYPIPANVDSVAGPLTMPTGLGWQHREVKMIREVEIRKNLARDNIAGHPRNFAIINAVFDPTTPPGSLRNIIFWPIPSAALALTGVFTLRPLMLDATNRIPLGAEVLAPVLLESVLAAAERNLEDNPQGPHGQQLGVMLAQAAKRDAEYDTADSLGQGRCDDEYDHDNHFIRHCGGSINMPGYNI
jgi:hypothetical protein